MKCKVVLMNPPTAEPTTEILLNLAYLSSTLKQAGHKVLILDATAPHNPLSENEIKQQILQFKPHFIGVTLTINYIPHTYDYLERLKQLNIPLVAGGPHANCLPEEVLQHSVDIVAIGEGEDTILELAEYFIGKKELKDIAGIYYRGSDGTFHYTAKRSLIENLDRIPFPDYDSFLIENYTGSSDPESNPIFWSVFSSRGCPYNCIFCSSHNVFGRTYRSRSPQNVFNEIEFLAEKYGAKKFAFQDDEAFIDQKRIIEFCDLVKNSRFPLKFSARLRIDTCNEEMLTAMKSVGFRRLSSGIESFNDETLKKINKKYDVTTIFKGFEILKKISFTAIGFNNIIGFPWETPEHLRNSIREISKIPQDLIYFSFTCTPVPYPGTKLYELYHVQYGFTNWWLDKKRNSPRSNPVNTFFMLFLPDQLPLYNEDIFWNYSPQMKKAILHFCWKTSSMYLQRCLRLHEYLFIFYFSKISYMLWKISPRLEKLFLYPALRLAKQLKLERKTAYVLRI